LDQVDNRVHARSDNTRLVQDSRSLAKEIRKANQILKMLGLKWDGIFGAIAAAHRKDVALLGLVPEPDKGIVKITAEAKNFSVMLDYVKRLEEQPELGEVSLQSHNMQNRLPQKPVRFVVMAVWLDK
jgi:hypothetical protein